MTGPVERTRRLRTEALSIAEDVRAAGLDLDGERSRVVGYIDGDGGLNLKTRTGLYCGQLGVAVYFAAVSAVTGEESYSRHAASAVTHITSGPPDRVLDAPYVGIGSGVGSVLYGLTLLADLTGEDRYEERAREIVRATSAATMEDDDQYDVLLGTAGAVTGLLAHYERSGDQEALARAEQWGQYLLESRYEKWGHYGLWDTSTKAGVLSTSTGMGHGVAGIVQALFRLYDHTRHDAFREAASEAVAFENLFYSGYEGNWKANFGGVEHYTNWWCSGLVGVGCARLASLAHHDSERLRRDLGRAVRGFEPRLLRNDSLCHGTFGQVDLLLELDRAFEQDYRERARDLALDALARRRETGHYAVANERIDGLSNPVFFLGTAGIGYTLLRLVEPETVPSVLRFE